VTGLARENNDGLANALAASGNEKTIGVQGSSSRADNNGDVQV
jgi:hypothetical protein